MRNRNALAPAPPTPTETRQYISYVGRDAVSANEAAASAPVVWRWRSKLGERYGQPCRVTARGRLNAIRVDFEDGFFVFTSRWAVRRA